MIRKYINIIYESENKLQEENEKLKKMIFILRNEIQVLHQKINNLEFALLNDKDVYNELMNEFNYKKEIVKNKNDDFVFLNERNKARKLR